MTDCETLITEMAILYTFEAKIDPSIGLESVLANRTFFET